MNVTWRITFAGMIMEYVYAGKRLPVNGEFNGVVFIVGKGATESACFKGLMAL